MHSISENFIDVSDTDPFVSADTIASASPWPESVFYELRGGEQFTQLDLAEA